MFSNGEPTYYSILELHPWASDIDIRSAYRELSKRYHPDTTKLPAAIATAKFQQINEAYAVLNNPERRSIYDLKIGQTRFDLVETPFNLHNPVSKSINWSSSGDFDPNARPLSSGEIFALFILGLTILGCLLLAIIIGLIRGETVGQMPLAQLIL